MPAYRSRTSTYGRNMAGARALWRATEMNMEISTNLLLLWQTHSPSLCQAMFI